jgi:hypothetical protein
MRERTMTYLAKLSTMADGALASISRKEQNGEKPCGESKAWWDGYRQCLYDVADYLEKQEETSDVR